MEYIILAMKSKMHSNIKKLTANNCEAIEVLTRPYTQLVLNS